MIMASKNQKARKIGGRLRRPPRSGAPEQLSDLITESDLQLAQRAAEKQRLGVKPSQEESRAYRRAEKAREEVLRWRFYRAIPQKHWRAMSGRHARTLNEQAERYDLPFGGASISLPAVARALHDFLAENARKLAMPESDDPLLVGGNSPGLERYREAKADMAEMERDERNHSLISRDELREGWTLIAGVLRRAGESLGRQHGEDAQAIMDDALDDALQLIEDRQGLTLPRTETNSLAHPTDARPPPA